MKSLVIAFGAAIMLILLPVLFLMLVDAQTSDYEQTFAGVATAASTYNASVTLGQALYENNTVSVSSVASNVTSDSPSAGSYNSVSRALVVGGLSENNTRTLSVTYDIEDPTLPTGFVTAFQITIWFLWLVCIGLMVGAVYAFFTS